MWKILMLKVLTYANQRLLVQRQMLTYLPQLFSFGTRGLLPGVGKLWAEVGVDPVQQNM